jgi:hypothetical protein
MHRAPQCVNPVLPTIANFLYKTSTPFSTLQLNSWPRPWIVVIFAVFTTVAAPGFLAPGGKCHICHRLPWLQPPSFGALSLWRPGAIAPSWPPPPRRAATVSRGKSLLQSHLNPFEFFRQVFTVEKFCQTFHTLQLWKFLAHLDSCMHHG